MSHPGALKTRASLQPANGDGYTCCCAVNGDGSRVIVGWDTGNKRWYDIYDLTEDAYVKTTDSDISGLINGEIGAMAMAASGRFMAIGDPYNSNGKGFICFYYGEDEWGMRYCGNIEPPGTLDLLFGYSCWLNAAGNRLYVGAPSHNNDQGAIYVYDITIDGNYSWVSGNLIATITLPGTEYFGSSVGLSADETLMAVGSDSANWYSGEVYILAKDSNGVFQLRDTVPPGNDYGGMFGKGVALSPEGNVLFVGASNCSLGLQKNGVVVAFEYTGGAWVPRYHRLPEEGWSWQNLGLNVALSHDGRVLVAGQQAMGRVFQTAVYGMAGNVVDDNGQPAQRRIFLHDATTGKLLDDTTSAADGSFNLAAGSRGSHYALCRDDADGVAFNAQVLDGVVPL